MSYLFYKHYLHSFALPPGAGGTPPAKAPEPAKKLARERSAEECERLIDDELATSMPASDAPSWTLGGSLASRRHH